MMTDRSIFELDVWESVARMRIEDRRVYEELVASHGDLLFRCALRSTGDVSISEDLVQETYEQAWRGISRLRSADAGRAWLLRILERRVSRYRKSAARNREQSDGMTNELTSIASRDDDAIEQLELKELLDTAMSRIDPRFRMPLVLVVLEEIPVREVGQILRMRRGTVLSRVHRGKEQLAAQLRRLGWHRELSGRESAVEQPINQPEFS